MKKLMLIVALLTVQVVAHSQVLGASENSNAPTWHALSSGLLTPNADWFAYVLQPADLMSGAGEVTVVLRNTKSGQERSYAAGGMQAGAGGLVMSPSGRFIAFRTTADVQGTRPAGPALTIIEIERNRRRDYGDVQDFAFLPDASARIVLLRRGGAQDHEGSLEVRSLIDDSTVVLGRAAEFSRTSSGTRIAWAGTAGVWVYDSKSGNSRSLQANAGCTYLRPSWSPTGGALAAFRRCAQGSMDILTFTALDTPAPVVMQQAPQESASFPSGYEISTQASFGVGGELRAPLMWRADEHGVFFGIRAKQAETANGKGKSSEVVLWRVADVHLPTQREFESTQAQFRSDWCYLDREERLVRIEAGFTRAADATVRGRYVLVYDPEPYNQPAAPNLEGTTHSAQLRDYFLIDLDTGERKRILEQLSVLLGESLSIQPVLSPDASWVLYQQNGDYKAYDVRRGTHRNLTDGLNTKFYFEENVRNGRYLRDAYWISSPLQGWSADGSFVLISDYYDIWALPLTDEAGPPVNLTVDGRRRNYAYRRMLPDAAYSSGRAVAGSSAQLTQPMYFRLINLETGQTTIARKQRTSVPMPLMSWADAEVRCTSVATRGYLCSYDSTYGTRHALFDTEFRHQRWLSDTPATQRQALHGVQTRFLSYTSAHGDRLHAVLYTPVGYVAGKSYPTVVSIYEQQAGLLHVPLVPQDPVFHWLKRGYAVIRPDIQPRINEAGKAALEGVLAAVDAAAATGVVDKSRLALIGHSHGGYEAYFIASQTKAFKAVVPQAGWANLLSSYGAIYERNGEPSSFSMEHEQPYMAGPWWQHWDAYIANSPLFQARNITTPMLIAHGRQDRLVPFTQALEMFNTLRRLGNTQVVLLEYPAADHSFEGADRQDLDARMEAFFDHFLNGGAAPSWWAGTAAMPAATGRVPAE